MNDSNSLYFKSLKHRLVPVLIVFGLLVPLLCFILIRYLDASFYVYLLIFLNVLDSGHIYTTFLRTHTKGQFESRKNLYSRVLLTSLGVNLFFLIVLPSLFWMYLVYFTLFHHIRQNFGIYKFIQYAEGKHEKIFQKLFYLLTVLPFVVFHFRENFKFEFYTTNPLLMFPNQMIFQNGMYLNVLLLFLVSCYFLLNKRLIRKSTFYLLGLSALYLLALNFSQSVIELLVVFILVHAVPYLLLMASTLASVSEPFKNKALKTLTSIILTIALFGGVEVLLEEEVLYDFFNLSQPTIFQCVCLAVFFTPLIYHYLIDAIIWKSNDKDFKSFLKQLRS